MASRGKRGPRNGNFRKNTSDEFGKSGFEQELERLLRCQEKQGTDRHTMNKRGGAHVLHSARRSRRNCGMGLLTSGKKT